MHRFRRLVVRLVQVLLLLLVITLGAALVLPLPGGPGVAASSLAGPGDRFLDLDGTATRITEDGPANGPAVVLVHGFGGSVYSWRFTRTALAQAGYHVLALDLRGFGLSAKALDADYSHGAQARLVLEAMDAVGMRSAVLVGHSMGGNVVAHVAQLAPDRVRALILVDAAVVPPTTGASPMATVSSALLQVPPVRRIVQFGMRLALGGGTLESMLRSAYADPAFPTVADVAAYGTAQQVADWDLALVGIVRDAGRNALEQPVASLGDGRPVLVAWGERDPWIPLATGEALRDAIPGTQWLEIAGAGHLPMEEGRDAFEQGLLAFLEALPQP